MAENKDHARHPQQRKQAEERQDWRRKSKQGGSARRAGESEGWHVGDQPTPRYSQYRYLIRMLGTTAILVVLLGMWFFYVSRRHNQVPLYTIIVTDYVSPYRDDILPPNALAHEDLELFQELFERRRGGGMTRNVGLMSLVEGTCTRSWLRDDLPLLLEKGRGGDVAQPGGPRNNVTMFYISAHGAVNVAGQACLLMSDSDPLDCNTWVRLVDVLGAISKVQRFSDCRKIVFLDASRMCENWQMGMLCNTFPLRVQSAVESLNDPNLVVISSADMGQSAWTVPEQACTAFGRVVANSLAGAGDRSGWLRKVLGLTDITLPKLAHTISSEVMTWSQQERGVVQRPLVHYAGGEELPNWTLADSAGKSVDDLDRKSRVGKLKDAIEQRLPDVGRFWNQMNVLAEQDAVLTDPLQWSTLQTSLVRLESLMFAGEKYDDAYSRLVSALEPQLGITAAQPVDRADASAPSRSGDSAAGSVVTQGVPSLPLARQLQGPPVGQDPLASPRARWASQPDATDEQWKDLPYLDAVDIGTAWLEKLATPTRDELKSVLALAETTRGNRACDVVEVQFLKMLANDMLPEPSLQTPMKIAMDCRFLAERAAAPRDPRAVFWVEEVVRQADPVRRVAEDHLLLGDQSPERAKEWEDLTQRYAEAKNTGDAVSEVLRIRDRAWADLTPLAMWKLREARSQRGGQPETIRQLLELIRQAHQLNAELVQRQDRWAPELEQTAKKVHAELVGWRRQFNEGINKLIDEDTSDADTLHRMSVMLAVPLRCGVEESAAIDPRKSRGAVLQRYVECLFNHVSDKEAATDQPTTGFVEELKHWKCHPLTAIVFQDQGTGDANRSDAAGAGWESQESELRQFLKATLPTTLGDAVIAGVSNLRGQNDDPTKSAYQQLHEAEGLYRAVAPVAAAVLNTAPHDDVNPVRLARQVAQLRQLLWQTQRTLDDCYLTRYDAQSPTFVQLASHAYRSSAQELETVISSGLPRALRFYERIERIAGSDLGPLTDSRSLARGLLTETTAIELPERDEDLEDTSSQQEVSHTVSVLAAPHLPPDGLGFLELTDNGQPFRIQDTRPDRTDRDTRHHMAVQADPQEFRFSVRRTDLVDVDDLEVRAYFRGAWDPQSIWVRGPKKGIRTVYPRPDYHQPRITIEGDSTKPVSLVFILDCSGTMAETMPTEQKGINAVKILAAQIALKTILNNLLQYQQDKQGVYRVGLILYGHRSKWRDGFTVKTVTDNAEDFNMRVKLPNEGVIHPNNDVETVFDELVPLTDVTLNQFRAEIDAVEPWGMTPLYAALVQAIELISRDNMETGAKHIIAITDGFNDTPPTPSRRYQLGSAAVMKAATEHPDVRIDIVEFDLRYAGDVKERYTLQEYKAKKAELAKITGRRGQSYPASEPGELISNLQDAIRPADVDVQSKTLGHSVYQQQDSFPLGSTWIDKAWNGQTDQCKLTIVQRQMKAETEVDLEGGEHLRLVFDGNRLVHRHRQFDDRILFDLRTNVAGKYDVAALVPVWDGGQLVFRVMVRNKSPEQFSRRPKQVWAEITPVGKESHAKLVFYDLEFENDTEVPVLRFRTPDWPLDADQAHIQLWFQMEAADPEAGYNEPIGKFAFRQRFAVGAEGVEAEEEQPVVSAKNQQTRYVVWEHYDTARASDMPLTRVQMTPTPSYSEHEVRREDGKVRHVFRYDPGLPQVAPRLQITTREEICNSPTAVSLGDQPLKVVPPPKQLTRPPVAPD